MARAAFVVVIVSILCGDGLLLQAHHSFESEFDRTKPVTVTGIVTKVEWTNPHGRFFLDV